MTIKVTEEMRQAALQELTDEEIKVPGVERPTWDKISEELDHLLTAKEEDKHHEP